MARNIPGKAAKGDRLRSLRGKDERGRRGVSACQVLKRGAAQARTQDKGRTQKTTHRQQGSSVPILEQVHHRYF